jgi:hypothetical protein
MKSTGTYEVFPEEILLLTPGLFCSYSFSFSDFLPLILDLFLKHP